MKVLLVTGIFFPDVGGPATHVRKIAEHFASIGWNVTVVAFGDHPPTTQNYRVVRISRKWGKLISWKLYALAVLRFSVRADVIYAFDLTTAGMPSAFFATLFRKPFILRIGGDPIWERVVEKGERFLPMRAYYEQRLFLEDKPILYRLIRRVICSADTIVMYCDFLKEIYVQHYGADEKKMHLIRNPFPQKNPPTLEEGTFTFLFAGRFVTYKNLMRVIRVFRSISEKHDRARLVLLGDGPEEAQLKAQIIPARIEILPKMDQKGLFARINAASVSLAPALTEFNPNFILESLALGKPALISRDNGLSANLPAEWQFDPLDDDSLQEAMERMLDPHTYQSALHTVAHLDMSQSWDKVVSQHVEIVADRHK